MLRTARSLLAVALQREAVSALFVSILGQLLTTSQILHPSYAPLFRPRTLASYTTHTRLVSWFFDSSAPLSSADDDDDDLGLESVSDPEAGDNDASSASQHIPPTSRTRCWASSAARPALPHLSRKLTPTPVLARRRTSSPRRAAVRRARLTRRTIL